MIEKERTSSLLLIRSFHPCNESRTWQKHPPPPTSTPHSNSWDLFYSDRYIRGRNPNTLRAVFVLFRSWNVKSKKKGGNRKNFHPQPLSYPLSLFYLPYTWAILFIAIWNWVGVGYNSGCVSTFYDISPSVRRFEAETCTSPHFSSKSWCSSRLMLEQGRSLHLIHHVFV
jgi:hypothetical protein